MALNASFLFLIDDHEKRFESFISCQFGDFANSMHGGAAKQENSTAHVEYSMSQHSRMPLTGRKTSLVAIVIPIHTKLVRLIESQ